MRDKRLHLRRFHAARRELLDSIAAAVARSPQNPELSTLIPALAQIEQVIASERRRTRRDERIVVVALCTTLVVALLLASAIPISSGTELRAMASSIELTSRAAQNLTNLLALTEVSISGASFTEGAAELGLEGLTPEAQLTSGRAPINLEPVRVSAGDRIELSTTARPGRYRLMIVSTRPLSMAFSLTGEVTVTDATQRTRNHAVPHQLTATWPRGASAVITVSTSETTLTRALAVDAIGFTEEEYVADVRKRVSSLRSGEVLFPDVDRALTLRDGHNVSIRGLDGDVRPIGAKDGLLAVAARGKVRALDVGEGRAAVSALPSALDYLDEAAGLGRERERDRRRHRDRDGLLEMVEAGRMTERATRLLVRRLPAIALGTWSLWTALVVAEHSAQVPQSGAPTPVRARWYEGTDQLLSLAVMLDGGASEACAGAGFIVGYKRTSVFSSTLFVLTANHVVEGIQRRVGPSELGVRVRILGDRTYRQKEPLERRLPAHVTHRDRCSRRRRPGGQGYRLRRSGSGPHRLRGAR